MREGRPPSLVGDGDRDDKPDGWVAEDDTEAEGVCPRRGCRAGLSGKNVATRGVVGRPENEEDLPRNVGW